MTAFALRVAEPGDEAAVTALTRSSYGALMRAAYDRSLLDKVLPIIGRANPKLLASGSYYLALSSGGEVIGAGGWTRDGPGSGKIEAGVGHIRHFATHPDWTGHGIGRALVDHCVSEARSQNMHLFECYSSLNAVDFYSRMGFKEMRPVELPFGGDLAMPAMLMERLL